MIFVYVRGLFGPSPEKWPGPLRDMHNKPLPTLAKHDLSPDEEELSLDQLVAKYPPPEVRGET